jgi:hypothetical protein
MTVPEAARYPKLSKPKVYFLLQQGRSPTSGPGARFGSMKETFERAASLGGHMDAGFLVVEGVSNLRLRLVVSVASGLLVATGQPV